MTTSAWDTHQAKDEDAPSPSIALIGLQHVTFLIKWIDRMLCLMLLMTLKSLRGYCFAMNGTTAQRDRSTLKFGKFIANGKGALRKST
jgi:hypothetical protein